MTRLLRLLVCRLTHDPPVHIANGRIWQRCEICHYETEGWRVHPPVGKVVGK